MYLNVSSSGDSCQSTGGRLCDTCQAATSTLYCHTEQAYLCASCDATIHGSSANPMNRWHKRVSLCMVCEHAPAALTCKADAASLCTSCDAEIHLANRLAARHERFPIEPLSGFLGDHDHDEANGKAAIAVADDNEGETDSWLMLNPDNNDDQSKNGFSVGEVDEYLDLTEYNSCIENQTPYQDQYNIQLQQQQRSFYFGMENEMSKTGFTHNHTMTPCVSMPFMDDGMLRETTISSISNSYSMPPEGMCSLLSSTALLMPTTFAPMNREAKVLRYREKRKARKFEKKIRYASRKAYAETRPRVKGRFARRTEMELQLDRVLSAAEYAYGAVSSF